MFESVLIMGLIVSFNILVLLYKSYKKKYFDLFIDLCFLMFLTNVFGGSIMALMQGNVASFFLSIILFFIPLEKVFPFIIPMKSFFGWIHDSYHDLVDRIKYGY